MSEFNIVIISGGSSAEREVSLRTGGALEQALQNRYTVRAEVIDSNKLPAHLNPDCDVVYIALHGTFGEDGGIQGLLEKRGVAYAGCDAGASRLCMDKQGTKEAVSAHGVSVVPGLFFNAGGAPSASDIMDVLGEEVVLKPNSEGSSVGLRTVSGRVEIEEALRGVAPGDWLAEKRIRGREFSIGVLDGRAMGVVEIVTDTGIYDYAHKYTSGHTEYRVPAEVDAAFGARLREDAEAVFRVCGCRDFARVDFIADADGGHYLLEINTLPGLTVTSLLPKSASVTGLDFEALAVRLVTPAIQRWRARQTTQCGV